MTTEEHERCIHCDTPMKRTAQAADSGGIIHLEVHRCPACSAELTVQSEDLDERIFEDKVLARAVLRAYGKDPAAVRKRGRAFMERLKSKLNQPTEK